MTEVLAPALAWLWGCALGAIFFGGLWLTVNKGLVSNQPALWFLGSLILRMGVVLVGFYFVADGNWERLLASLVGFLTARLVVTWMTRPSTQIQVSPAREVSHSP
jgi:F1F0 ATPase subunit 2